MTAYPFVTLDAGNINDIRVERLNHLERELAFVLLEMSEPSAAVNLGQRHHELVQRMEVHRAALGLPSALAPAEEEETTTEDHFADPVDPDPADLEPTPG